MVKFPLLDSLPAAQQKDFFKNLSSYTLEDGSIIFENGDSGDDIYFILEGGAKSVNYGPGGELAYFRYRKAGEFFGYYSAFTRQPRTARMVAVGHTTLARMPAKEFMSLITNNPAMSEYMLCLITSLLREETKRITGMITLNARQRVCAEIISNNPAQTSQSGTRQEMAARLGLSRETLSRILNSLEREEAIRMDTDRIAVLNLRFLQDVAEGIL